MRTTITFDVRDVEKFRKTCKTMGEKTAMKAAKKAAQKSSNVMGKAIRSAAPRGATGELKRSFKKKQEKSAVYGKVVYYYAVDKDKNAIFQKPIKNVGKYGGKHDYAYYPASVEYGYLASDGNGTITYTARMRGSNQHSKKEYQKTRQSSRHVEGQHFVRDAANKSEAQARAEMSRVLNEELDKVWTS